MIDRNNMVSFWRVVFTYVIVVYHLLNQYGRPTALFIGVEFFFVVSGWLLSVDLKTKNRTPYEYTLHRIKRLYPEYLPAFLVSAACLIIFNRYSLKNALNWAGTIGIKELLCIHYWPWNDAPLANVATWYISVLILAGLFLYSLCKRFPKVTREIIIPLVIVIGLTYSYREDGSLAKDFYEGIYHHRFVRGFLEMGIGVLLSDFSDAYGKYFKNKLVQTAAFIGLAFTVAASFFRGGKFEYLYLLLISFGVAVSFNTKQLFKSKIMMFFDKISYSLFLNHIIFRTYFMPRFFDSLSIKMILIYLAAVTVFSIGMFYLSKALNSLFEKCCMKVFKKQIADMD